MYFLYYASSLSTWFCSNSKGWAADLEIVYETLKWKNPHLSRSLHSISHIHRMSRIRSPLPFECSLCQPSLVALVSVLVFHFSAPDYRYSHSPSGLYFRSGMIFSMNLYSLQQKYFIISRTLTCSKEIYCKIFWRIVSLLTLRGPHQFIRSWVKKKKIETMHKANNGEIT